jgi:hypothetical protein
MIYDFIKRAKDSLLFTINPNSPLQCLFISTILWASEHKSFFAQGHFESLDIPCNILQLPNFTVFFIDMEPNISYPISTVCPDFSFL